MAKTQLVYCTIIILTIVCVPDASTNLEPDEKDEGKSSAEKVLSSWSFKKPSVQRKKVAKRSVDPSTLLMEFDEIFSLGYIQLDRFANRLNEAKKKANAEEHKSIKIIDLSKVGYITDAAIKVLVETLGKETFDHVHSILLEGSSVLTNVGLHWLVKALEGSKTSKMININGCTKVTDGGISALVNCNSVGIIEAISTSVSHVQNSANTKGCPLLVDPLKLATETQREAYLMVMPIKTEDSLAEYLGSGKQIKRKSLHNLPQMKVKDWKLNVVEVESDHILFEHLLPPNPHHVIIPFDASADLNKVKEEAQKTMAHVLSKESPNPQHKKSADVIISGSNGWLDCSKWNRLDFRIDGSIRNITEIPENIGAVVSRTPMSRSNHYFEVQVIEKNGDAGMVIGVMHDILLTERYPMDSKEKKGGAVDGFKLEEEGTFGFGIEGPWKSEYVPGDDATYYFTHNGTKVDKQLTEIPHIGMYPMCCVLGKNIGRVKVLNTATPPELLQMKWEKEKQYFCPGFQHNIFCDDRGFLTYRGNYRTEGEIGLFSTQQQVSRELNTFSIRIIDLGKVPGAITMGLGPENYALNKQPGWEKHSLALHGDNGQMYIEKGKGIAAKDAHVWEVGDVITVKVVSLGQGSTLQDGDTVGTEFFVNDKLTTKAKLLLKGYNGANRIVFLVGMSAPGAKVEIQNFRPVYLPPPPKLDKLTMGRSDFMDIMDDGRLIYRKFDTRELFSLYLSRTPFNKRFTYFEMTVKNIGQKKHCGIGLAHRDYPVNAMIGWMQSSIAYHADNGNVYTNSSSGIKSTILPDNSDCSFNNGDKVGCGIDENSTKFRDDGSLENQQLLTVYFTKNGKKVHSMPFHYETDGIYPGVSLHFEDNEVLLHNYYSGPESGPIVVKDATKKEEVDSQFTEGCKFTLVCMGSDSTDIQAKTKALQKMFENGPDFSMLLLINESIKTMGKDIGKLNFQEQQHYGQLLWQKECLERFSKSKSRLDFLHVDISSADSKEELTQLIVKNCEEELSMHHKYFDLHIAIKETMAKTVRNIISQKIVVAHELKSLVSKDIGFNGKLYEILIRFLQRKGYILWVPMKRTVVAIDITFAGGLTDMSQSLSKNVSGKMAPCIGEETRVWSSVSDISPAVKGFSKTKAHLMNHVLLFFGLMEIPRLKVTKEEPYYCYCTPSSIGKLPVQLTDFLPSKREDLVTMSREYHFLYSNPHNILSLVASRCITFSRPLVISSNWCVFQTGAAQTVIFLKEMANLPNTGSELCIETHCFMPQEESETLDKTTRWNVEEYTFNIFSIFIDVIDLIITRIRLKVVYSQKTPERSVNTSIGCSHTWGLSEELYRQTRCTLCNLCCDQGRLCPFNGISTTYAHQCGCGTIITGCRDCGICQECADTLWTIRSYLRPNLEVACYEDMKTNQLFPLNGTTYDEVEVTNLGSKPTAVCLQELSDSSSSLTKLFPGKAMIIPNASDVEQEIKNSKYSIEYRFDPGDTVTVKLDPVKRDHKVVLEEEIAELPPSEPIYHSCICRGLAVWHEAGVLAYKSTSRSTPVSQFVSANPLSPECPSFSYQIINPGKHCYIAIGICKKRYPANRQPGWNSGSFGYHADDGGIFMGHGYASTKKEKCTKGDIMKCSIDFENRTISFFKNGNEMYTTQPQSASGFSYHAVVGLHSYGEAVKLLEKEPWQPSDMNLESLPMAFESYKYGNMYLSPGRTLSIEMTSGYFTGWLMLHNPSKNIVGYKNFFPDEKLSQAKYLEPGQTVALYISIAQSKVTTFQHLQIHWFVMESSRDYTNVVIDEIYQATTPESLLRHRLKVKIIDGQASDNENLKTSDFLPDSKDGYLAEVFKNGISVQKYWLKDGMYVCHIPIESNVLVRYPKFPTLDQPNEFQRGVRVLLDLSEKQKNTYAECVIKDVMNGIVTLEYSIPGDPENCFKQLPVNSPLIQLKNVNYRKVKMQVSDEGKNEKEVKDEKDKETKNETDGKDDKDDYVMEPDIQVVSYEPRGNLAVLKRAYKIAPLHLLTKEFRDCIFVMDSSWESASLQSVALCKTLPTRMTVQELQIIQLSSDNDLDWLKGPNPFRKFDRAFAFLPAKLDKVQLCYPTVHSIFTDIEVHMLCFLVDQMYYNLRLFNDYQVLPDAPLHFVNVPPISPYPGLSCSTMFTSGFNGWTYSTLYLNRLLLPLCDNIFTGGKPDFDRVELEMMMKSLIHIYACQCHLFAEQQGGIVYQSVPDDGTKTICHSIAHESGNYIRTNSDIEKHSDVLLKKPFRDNLFCKAHQWSLEGTTILSTEDDFSFSEDLFAPYHETVNLMFKELPSVISLPDNFFTLFKNLQYLKLSSCDELKTIPTGISKCSNLEMVCFEMSGLGSLPDDLLQIPSLLRLHCQNLKITALPTNVAASCPLKELKLCNLLLTSLPPQLGLLSSLEVLNLNGNLLGELPQEMSKLKKLKTLHLCGVPWIVTNGSKIEMPLDQYEEFLKRNTTLTNCIGLAKAVSLFNEFDHNHNSRLEVDEIAALNNYFFWSIPRLGLNDINDTECGGIPEVIFSLTGLENLYLDFQAITAVPVHMCRLQNLKILSISHNPLLESLPGTLGHLPNLKSLRLLSNPSLRTPPHEVVSRGFLAVKAYLKRLAGGFTECRRTKLMFVGLGGAGKTSLLRALMSGSKKTTGTKGEDITDGIMIQPWTVKTASDVEITYSTWDFAGQTLYYNTHQFFLSKRAVYLLLWSTRQGFEHSGIEFWLSSIASHTVSSPIFVVGTHCDQVPKVSIPKSDLQQRYPQIVGFHFVSSLEGMGIAELEKELLRVTLEQKNMGEKVPQVWLNMEKKILSARMETSILPWDIIKKFAVEVGLYDDKDIREAIQFLNELGTVQYFDNEFLREQVVINPQWIVNVMACVVSVKNSPIQDHEGLFQHKYIPQIWKDYPENLHMWLLRLTEEFDLTFPLPKENVNIVPCILPQEMPKELNWPNADLKKKVREMKILYTFVYLPIGLFNRAQVRLFQFSDGKLMWKKGSLLKKNKHLALIMQTSENELLVRVQGPRPENVIFLIHEIFESLIEESFRGVSYDFMVPCPDCLMKEGTLEPSLFDNKLIQRAREYKAPFLQCRKYFHTISMTQLIEIMPSDSATDFDAQLQSSLALMQDMNRSMSVDIAIIYCTKDLPDGKDPERVDPEWIKNDLEAVGHSCWLSKDMANIPMQDLMIVLKNSKMLVVLVSDNFEKDEKTRDLLLYAMDNLNKEYVIVCVGNSLAWQETHLGMRIGKQEFMVMIKTKSRYQGKIQELQEFVNSKLTGIHSEVKKYPSVFVSYCWSNSHDAKAKGTNSPASALGWGDPRQIKKDLEKCGISCWLDIDMTTSTTGLFKNITEGLRNAKVLLVCVSDEYVKSDNCMMEIRFGVLNMNLPTVIAVVGTGKEWKQSEVGILMQRSKSDKVYFQLESPSSMDTLESYIRQRLPDNVENLIKKEAAKKNILSLQEQEKQKGRKDSTAFVHSAIQEEYELVQRKFMRHIISYVSNQDTLPLPRLIVVDYEKPVCPRLTEIQFAFHSGSVNLIEPEPYFDDTFTCRDKIFLQDLFSQAFSLVSDKIEKYLSLEGQPGAQFLKDVQFFYPRKVAFINFEELSGVPGLRNVPMREVLRYREYLAPSAVKSSASGFVDPTLFWKLCSEELPNLSQLALKSLPESITRRLMYEINREKLDRTPVSLGSPQSAAIDHTCLVMAVKNKQDSEKDKAHEEVGSIRSSFSRPTLRPRTANKSKMAMKAISEGELEIWENEGFCFKVLCEHEEGWHICKTAFPVKVTEDFKNRLRGCSAYLARMYAILRQSGVRLNCFQGSKGNKFISWIDKCASENFDFVDSFTAMRTKLSEDEAAQDFLFQLGRFHLPTGKIYWLCKKHSNGPRMTRLSTESASAGEVGRVLEEEDTKMKDILEKSSEYRKKKAIQAPKKQLNLPIADTFTPEPTTSTAEQSIKDVLNIHQAQMKIAALKDGTQNQKAVPEEADLGKRPAHTDSEDKVKNEPKAEKLTPSSTPTPSAKPRKQSIQRLPQPSVSRASNRDDKKDSKTCTIQ